MLRDPRVVLSVANDQCRSKDVNDAKSVCYNETAETMAQAQDNGAGARRWRRQRTAELSKRMVMTMAQAQDDDADNKQLS